VDQKEFEAIKATFPWTEQIIATGVGGVVRVLDNRGQEVSIFVMTRFLEMITRKLVNQPTGGSI
jgi:hypothetical protein